ncbi:MAG: polysaccharide deacetylase family protein [Ilumatobacter sp.]|nr:polysaccharide deacetylase family protein [Ilumatobacter sp.]
MMRATDLVYAVGDPVLTKLLSPPHGGRRHYVNHGPRTERRVALTFDDGPCRGSTERLLDALGELEAPGTFFCVGENVRLNPELVERLDREGHVVGSHSERHSRGAGLSFGDTEHILAAERRIATVLGKRPALYRPPWGWLTPWEGRRLQRLGYTIIGWDVYTLDWQIPEPDPADVVSAAIADTEPGSIFCFHDAFPLEAAWDKDVTVDTIRELVPRLRSMGYEFVTVSDLLGVDAYRAIEDVAA